ncbi:MAG: methionine--tRNA ligase subunit beta [Chloroflexi bacterium]|nr:methionine--tRNA ligase subunit beta [Chloroflexota bacterium]
MSEQTSTRRPAASSDASSADVVPAAESAAATPAPAAPAPAVSADDGIVTIDDFAKLDLRVALVTAVERVPKTEKLLKLSLDLGFEQRTIVSGIAQFYEPEQLVGRRIVIIANLKPAKIRGVESRGMLLAAGGRGEGEQLGLITLDKEIPAGTRVS